MPESPMDKHTRLPWTLHHGKNFSQANSQDAKREFTYNYQVFECHRWCDGGHGPDEKESIANAEFITTACNTYYQNQEIIKELEATERGLRKLNQLQHEMIQGQEIRILELEALSKLKDDKSHEHP